MNILQNQAGLLCDKGITIRGMRLSIGLHVTAAFHPTFKTKINVSSTA